MVQSVTGRQLIPEDLAQMAPPFTVNENWPILNRPPPEPDLPPSSVHVVDPDEPPPF
jgi:hypothetical protein